MPHDVEHRDQGDDETIMMVADHLYLKGPAMTEDDRECTGSWWLVLVETDELANPRVDECQQGLYTGSFIKGYQNHSGKPSAAPSWTNSKCNVENRSFVYAKVLQIMHWQLVAANYVAQRGWVGAVTSNRFGNSRGLTPNKYMQPSSATMLWWNYQLLVR